MDDLKSNLKKKGEEIAKEHAKKVDEVKLLEEQFIKIKTKLEFIAEMEQGGLDVVDKDGGGVAAPADGTVLATIPETPEAQPLQHAAAAVAQPPMYAPVQTPAPAQAQAPAPAQAPAQAPAVAYAPAVTALHQPAAAPHSVQVAVEPSYVQPQAPQLYPSAQPQHTPNTNTMNGGHAFFS